MKRPSRSCWARRPSSACQARTSRPPRRGRNAYRPAVEALEPRWTPTVTFSSQQTFSAGTMPVAVAIGDFNGDGRPDLVVANRSDNTVSVFVNTTGPGAGGADFAAQQTFATGSQPFAVAVGDFNGDGRLDLAVANIGDSTVSVLLNTTPAGSATLSFGTQQTFAVGPNQPFAVAVADVNGDGRPDLAVTNFGSNTVSVLLNTTPAGAGSVSFAAQQTFATSNFPHGVAVADVNGDGRPDLVVANSSDNSVGVLLNTTPAGSGTVSFAAKQTFAVGTAPFGVAVGDFNGDGRPDVAVINQLDKTVSVLLNTTAAGAGTATFAGQQTFATGTSPDEVAVADLDGDGRPDLVVTNAGSSSVSVQLNTTAVGATTLSFAGQQTFAVGSAPIGVAVGDFNGDGRPDLAASNFGTTMTPGTTVSVLLNTTAPFASTTPVLVGQFGSTGVWELNRAFNAWVQLTPANATSLSADPLGDVAGAFKGAGVWLYHPSNGWHQIATGDGSLLAMDANGDVAGEFPGAGIWLFRPAIGFRQIGTGDASLLAMDAYGDVAGSFPGHGVWEFRPALGFQQLSTADASVLTMDALGDVIGTFPGAGIWEFRLATGFKQINNADATALAADPSGNVVASFAGMGVGLYQPTVGWRLFLPAVAAVLGMDALGDMFGVFTGYGVWESGAFRFGTQLRANDATVLAVA
jgi:hypothetical protein